ncbi:hypothetical protein IWW50_004574, partial [Coemansia erecta]
MDNGALDCVERTNIVHDATGDSSEALSLQQQTTTPPATATSDGGSTATLLSGSSGSPEEEITAEPRPSMQAAALATNSPLAKSEDDGLDFSFHDLMDAELMSVNELETLWTTSNPAADADLRFTTALETIPESGAEDAADAETHSDDELPTRLTQKLLALSAGSKGAAGVVSSAAGMDIDPPPAPRAEIHSAPEPRAESQADSKPTGHMLDDTDSTMDNAELDSAG